MGNDKQGQQGQAGRRCSERGSWAKPDLTRFSAGDANQAPGQNADGVAGKS
jgi:hypothetical protein